MTFFLDVPQLRTIDISFALTAVLNTLWPAGARTLQINSHNSKGAPDMRAGSLTFAARDAKLPTKISITLYQIGFLGKILFLLFSLYFTFLFYFLSSFLRIFPFVFSFFFLYFSFLCIFLSLICSISYLKNIIL